MERRRSFQADPPERQSGTEQRKGEEEANDQRDYETSIPIQDQQEQ
jgi:hypothetical protein